jgi:hypothetical protein
MVRTSPAEGSERFQDNGKSFREIIWITQMDFGPEIVMLKAGHNAFIQAKKILKIYVCWNMSIWILICLRDEFRLYVVWQTGY